MIERQKTEQEAHKQAQEEFEKAVIIRRDATDRAMQELDRN
jgi:hypothetical protein